MKRAFCIMLIIAAAAAAPPAALAQEGGGGTRSVFTLGAGSRAISMGGAFTATGDDASALYYNPAMLRFNDAPNIMASHVQLFSGFSDATYDYFGLVFPTLGAGSFGIGLLTTGTGGIRGFDEFSRETGEFSYRESQGMVAYAFNLPWRFAGTYTLGASVKVLNQKVGDFSDTGTGLDLGLVYRQDYIEGLSLGANIQDIVGARTKLVSASDEVYRTMMFGVGYTRGMGESSELTLAVQMDMPEKADSDIRFGAEYSYRETVSIRLGFDSEQITAGVGFGWRGYRADYGYFSRDEAGSSHPLTLSARIGTRIEEKIRRREEIRKAEEERMIDELFARMVLERIESARSHIESGELESALDEVKIALEFDPANEKAAELFEEISNGIRAAQEERTRDAEKALLINQHFNLGLDHYERNEYMLARAEFRNVLDLDPENEQAAGYLERISERLDEQVAAHRAAAIDNERSGRLTAAMNEWNLVRMIDPENTEASAAIERIGRELEAMGRDYRSANRRLETIELFERAARMFAEGRYPESAGLLRRVLQQEPDHEEAKDLLRKAERRMTPLTDEQKEEIRRLFVEGGKYYTKGDYAKAIEIWSRIIEISPENSSVLDNIEKARRRLEKIDSGEGNGR